MQGS
jgi:serine/threonine protein kinase